MFEILAGQVGKLSANVIYQIWVMIQLVFFTLVESLIIKTLLLDYNVDFILTFIILTISYFYHYPLQLEFKKKNFLIYLILIGVVISGVITTTV